MVSSSHEVPHHIIREDPDAIVRLGAALGRKFPRTRSVEIFLSDATETRPVERRIDSAFKIETYQQNNFLVLLEVQRAKAEEKIPAWLYYQAYMQERYKLPAIVMVLCYSDRVADWAVGPHSFGPEDLSTALLQPWVLSPRTVPKMLDVDAAAKDIALAVLSAIVHAESPDMDRIQRTVATVLGRLSDLDFTLWAELLERGLGDTQAAENWRTMMSVDLTFFQSKTSQWLRAEGREEGLELGRLLERGRNIVAVMKAREVRLSSQQIELIEVCTDEALLDLWFARSLTATSVEELLGPHIAEGVHRLTYEDRD